jgi:hypothetical protein
VVRAGRVGAPLEDVARDEVRPGHEALGVALGLGADVDDAAAGPGGVTRLMGPQAQPRPCPLEQLVDLAR